MRCSEVAGPSIHRLATWCARVPPRLPCTTRTICRFDCGSLGHVGSTLEQSTVDFLKWLKDRDRPTDLVVFDEGFAGQFTTASSGVSIEETEHQAIQTELALVQAHTCLQIADDIRSQILEGTLQAGDQLPSEPGFMADYGVSRIVVR
jgi:hypothetical protein